ncbi:MAG TPA: hypothetical protein VFN74_18355, partial [Chloroflexota bacterium]|nr:hypothetical protein [Chloroflexota bacterium]
LLLGAAFALPLSVPAVAVATVASFVAMGAATVAVNTLLIGETSAGKATTMAVNQAFMSLGGASGSSLGGLLLAVGDYSAIGGAVLLCAVASPLCAWLSGRAAVPAYGIPAYLGIMWPWKWGKLSDGCESGAVCVASRDGAVRWDRACRRKIG